MVANREDGPSEEFIQEKNNILSSLNHRKDADKEMSIDAIETIQVIAALLSGTGISFLETVETEEYSILSQTTLFFILIFVGLNLYGLVVTSSTLFYLRQCMAKDKSMFDPFMEETKNVRYYALKGVLYSMVSLVAVVGLRVLKNSENSTVSKFGGTAFIGLSIYCIRVMFIIRQAFAKLRKKSKSRMKLKSAGCAVMLATTSNKKLK